MPGRGTPHAAIRMPEDVWRRFGEAAKAQGTDRSALVRAFVAWYMREQGAELPRRPSAKG